MSYSSQRYDLDAAAARKRSQFASQSRDQRYYDQSYKNRTRNNYYRAPETSRASFQTRREGRPYAKREERSQSQRTRTKEEDRSNGDQRRRGERSPSNREALSSSRRDGRTSEGSRSPRDAHTRRESRPDAEKREHTRPEEVRPERRTSSRRESRDGLGTKVHSKREDASQREGEYSHLTPEEINTFLNSGRASKPSWGPSSTYGTYVFPLDSRGQHQTKDPTKCTCKCCPHPIGIAHGHNHRSQGPGTCSKRAAAASSRSRRTSDGRYLIQVIDKSRSTLNRENGPRYPISLDPRASCDHIASFLAPEKRYAKVVVHWDNGRVQRLDSQISMEDLIRHAQFLEVKEIKSVHWAM
ncbi:hypothetical protein FLONG3_3431 [Fusarium longipes]|uniref:Uncharacterized protein n=1 Tax=Fusarium longipes TaxID=694270 RepID=A0A395T1N3_9HYPO|nr:hypothetical protein FLONG3_3431 [Fusarium longipes]